MTNPSHHLQFHGQRAADAVHATRQHPLAQVHPLHRRAPLGRVFRTRRRDEPYVREFKIA